MRKINEIKDKYKHQLLNFPGVSAVSIGFGKLPGNENKEVIKVHIDISEDKQSNNLDLQIPRFLEGFPVEIEEKGPSKAY